MIVKNDVSLRGAMLSQMPLRDLTLLELAQVYAHLVLTYGEQAGELNEVIEEFEKISDLLDTEAIEQEAFENGYAEGRAVGYDEGFDDGYEEAYDELAPGEEDEEDEEDEEEEEGNA